MKEKSCAYLLMSLARRAWIEIIYQHHKTYRLYRCRLRVERGLKFIRKIENFIRFQMSLARRAWIEIANSSSVTLIIN